MARPRRFPRTLARLAGLALLLWLASSALVTWQLVRRPHAPHAEETPSWLAAEDLRLATRDGEELAAWFHAGETGRACLLFFHGIDASRSAFARFFPPLARQGFTLVAVTLRSHGNSSGGRMDFGYASRADVIAGVDLAERRAPGAPLIVIGQSLGAAAAIYAAPELGARVAGYVLEAPYRDLDKACRDRIALRLPEPFVTVAFLGLRAWSWLFLPTDPGLLRPIDSVPRFPVGVPVLFVAGGRDREAPEEDVRELAARCSGSARVELVPEADHRELWEGEERELARWTEFARRVEVGRAGAH